VRLVERENIVAPAAMDLPVAIGYANIHLRCS
jgi:hypothetical protein